MNDLTLNILMALIATNNGEVHHKAIDALHLYSRICNIEGHLQFYEKFHPSLDVKRECGNLGDTYHQNIDVDRLPRVEYFKHVDPNWLEAVGWREYCDISWSRQLSQKYIRECILKGARWEDLRWEIREALKLEKEHN